MLKIKYDNQIHIFRLLNVNHTVQGLQNLVKNTFKNYPSSFGFVFIDQEGDQIEVTTNEDIANIIELAKMNQVGKAVDMVKLIVKEERVRQQPVEHEAREHCYENYFEVMQEETQSEYEELRSCEQSAAIEIIPEDEEQLISSGVFAELIDQNLRNIQHQCVEKILQQAEEETIRSQVQGYLAQMQELIIESSEVDQQLAKIEARQSKTKRKRLMNSKGVEAIVEKSLQKLLPGFIQRLSYKTAVNVREILARQ